MKKIISLFERNWETDNKIRNEVTKGAEWVVAGEGIATRKYDGTACLIKDGKLFKRYDVKKGRKQPDGFIPAQDPDPTTGHWPGWVPCDRNNPSDKYHWEAFDSLFTQITSEKTDGTYELLGPKVQGNPEHFPDAHVLLKHNKIPAIEPDPPRDFDGLKEYFKGKDIEGIVWHHPDGRMVKIKKRDFGMNRID